MTKEEAAAKYNIPLSLLDEYAEMNLCGSVKQVMSAWQYNETDIERLSIIMTLHDIGFTREEVEQYMHLLLDDRDTEKERLQMLEKKRSGTLDEIHFRERRLERLDYLRFKMQREKK